MDQILAQVRQARRRLWLELLVNRLMRCWFAALAVAVVAIAAPKVVAIENLPADWTLWCLTASLAVAMVVALSWTWLRGRSELDAAVELDSRFGLRERVASSLSLTPALAETPMGRALTADTLRAVRRLHVKDRFPVRVDRRGWLPLVSALAAFVLMTFAENRPAESSIDPHAQQHAQEPVDTAAKQLRERMVERRKEAAAQGLKDAEGLFRELEKQTGKLAENKQVDRKQALVKLNDLAKQLEERRQRVGGPDEMRKQLNQMSGLGRGPADKMVDAMKQGQWKQAQEEAERLQEQVENEHLDDGAKRELTDQLDQMRQKMAEASAVRAQAMENLQQQVARQQQLGNLERAGQLQQKLEQMQSEQLQMSKLNELAQLAGECQQCMKQGDAQGAAKSLRAMAGQMDQMQQAAAEGKMLNAALDQLQSAKNAMACQQCRGEGCEACQGSSSKSSHKPGSGMGDGSSPGIRPQEGEVKYQDERIRQTPGPGSAVIVGEADGPNLRSQVAETVLQEMSSSSREPADPQVLEQLPQSRREHAQEYFNLLGEGR
jgi:hypothetical protein